VRVRLPLSAPRIRIQIDRILLWKQPKWAHPGRRLTAVLTAVEAGTQAIVPLTPAGPGPIGWLPAIADLSSSARGLEQPNCSLQPSGEPTCRDARGLIDFMVATYGVATWYEAQGGVEGVREAVTPAVETTIATGLVLGEGGTVPRPLWATPSRGQGCSVGGSGVHTV